MTALTDLTLLSLSDKLRAREVSPVEATKACLARIEATEGSLNAYVRLTPEIALAQAAEAEAEIAKGRWRGPLHGVPIALKDLFDLEGTPTTASSKQRENWTPPGDSAVAARLKATGAVIVGKTHTHEFAYGIATPTTANPWDVTRIPGGSSGGSSATVAARGCYMAMGSDTGGSIRIPASLCNLVGIKPTFGRVSRAGVASLAWGLDHVGPLTRTVADAAACMNALAGYDPRDPGSVPEPVPDYLSGLGAGVKGLRIGVPRNYFFDHVDAEVEAATRAAIATLETLGATLVEVEIPLPDQIMPVEFAICLPEASAYHRTMLRTAPELYSEDVRAYLEAGEMVPATVYIQALRVRQLIKEGFRETFRSVDAVAAPTVTATAIKRGAPGLTWPDGTEESASSIYVRLSAPANVTGLPSVTVPCGFSKEGLPIGFQIMGRPFDEATILRIGAAYEATTDFAERAPPV